MISYLEDCILERAKQFYIRIKVDFVWYLIEQNCKMEKEKHLINWIDPVTSNLLKVTSSIQFHPSVCIDV